MRKKNFSDGNECIGDVFYDERLTIQNQGMLKSEVRTSQAKINRKKETGSDGFVIEMLLALDHFGKYTIVLTYEKTLVDLPS